MRFEYDIKKEQDPRSEFANAMCKLLVEKNKGNLENAVRECYMSVYIHFDENVRNIYELTDTEIPLFGWMRLIRHTKEELDMTNDEFQYALSRAKMASLEFYCV